MKEELKPGMDKLQKGLVSLLERDGQDTEEVNAIVDQLGTMIIPMKEHYKTRIQGNGDVMYCSIFSIEQITSCVRDRRG